MESVIAIGIGICIGCTPVVRNSKLLKLIVMARTGG